MGLNQEVPAPKDPSQSLRSIVMEMLFPHDLQGKAILFFVLLGSLAYWLCSFWLYPDAPLSVTALYRGNDDIHYYPLVKALSGFRTGESFVHEFAGSGLRSFPFLPLFPHAVLFRFLGPACFIAADLLFVWLHYSFAAALLRSVGIRQKFSRLAGFCLTLGVLNCSVKIRFPPFFSLLNTCLDFNFWDWRFPRPLISGPVLLLALIVLVTMFNSARALKGRAVWILLGLSTACLIQTDMFSAIVFCFCAAPVILFMFIAGNSSRGCIVRGVILSVFAGTMACLPFFIQRIYEHPDIPPRLGLFPVDRFAFLFQPQGLSLAALVLILFSILEVLRRCLPAYVSPLHTRSSRLFAFMCLPVCFALPVSVLLSGKTIQPYHFSMVSSTFLSYGVLIQILILLEIAASIYLPFPSKAFRRMIWRTIFISTVVFCLLVNVRAAWRSAQLKTHIRADFQEFETLPDYRSHFTELVQELQKKKYAACRVAGTFDCQVICWWLTFGGGESFLADPFLSTLPDEEIELRLIYFCQLLGMDSVMFSEFITRYYVNIVWLGHNKYQASRVYRYSDPGDYSPESLKKIFSTPGVRHWEETWTLFLPLSVQKRLRIRYEQEKRDKNLRLDLIILTRNDIKAGRSPVSEDFVPVFENPVFKVWINKRVLNEHGLE